MKKIKANLDCIDSSKMRTFEIIDYADFPSEGGNFKGGVVTAMFELYLAKDQPSEEVYSYNYYEVTVEEEAAGDKEADSEMYFIALSRWTDVKMAEVLRIDRILPTAECVDIVYRYWLNTEYDYEREDPYYLADIANPDWDMNDSIVKDFFGLEPEEYEDAVSNIAFTRDKKTIRDVRIDVDSDGISFYCMVPYWIDVDHLVEIHVTDEMLEQFPQRSASDLHPAVCSAVLDEIEKSGNNFEDCAVFRDNPDWRDLVSTDEDECEEILSNIFFVCHADFKELMLEMGVSRKQMSEMLRIPLRTIEDWRSGKSECKMYMRLMIAECLGYLKLRRG